MSVIINKYVMPLFMLVEKWLCLIYDGSFGNHMKSS